MIALIGLLGGFLLMDWGNIADTFGRRSGKEAIEEGFRRAHFLAETGDRSIRMRFAQEDGTLILEDAENGDVLETMAVPGVEEIRRVDGRSSAMERIRSRDEYFSVRFGRDGSAEPIVFQVTRSQSKDRFHNHPFSGQLLEGEGADGMFFVTEE